MILLVTSFVFWNFVACKTSGWMMILPLSSSESAANSEPKYYPETYHPRRKEYNKKKANDDLFSWCRTTLRWVVVIIFPRRCGGFHIFTEFAWLVVLGDGTLTRSTSIRVSPAVCCYIIYSFSRLVPGKDGSTLEQVCCALNTTSLCCNENGWWRCLCFLFFLSTFSLLIIREA